MSLRSNHQLTITHGAMSLSLTLSVFTPVIRKMLGLLQEVQLVLLSALWSSALQSSKYNAQFLDQKLIAEHFVH